VETFKVDDLSVSARDIRIETESFRTCPTWHKGSGGPSWIFADEIRVH
jgi:hypothetical protein